MTTMNKRAADGAGGTGPGAEAAVAVDAYPSRLNDGVAAEETNLGNRLRLLFKPGLRRRRRLEQRAREIELSQWYSDKRAREAAARSPEENTAFALDAANDDESRRQALYRLPPSPESRRTRAQVYAEIQLASERSLEATAWKTGLMLGFILLCAGSIIAMIIDVIRRAG